MANIIIKTLLTPFIFLFGLLCGLIIMLITPFEYVGEFWRDEL